MIEVVDHDPAWADRFAEIRAALRTALGGVPVVGIEHVGSTSVPGLAAKPVIDVAVVVERDQVDAAITAMEAAGYVYRGDLGIPDRHAFHAPPGAVRQHTYVVVEGCLSLRNHLAVRDVLRVDAHLRDEYGAVKRRLAATTDDIDLYCTGKTDVLLRVLRSAGLGEADLAAIEAANR